MLPDYTSKQYWSEFFTNVLLKELLGRRVKINKFGQSVECFDDTANHVIIDAKLEFSEQHVIVGTFDQIYTIQVKVQTLKGANPRWINLNLY